MFTLNEGRKMVSSRNKEFDIKHFDLLREWANEFVSFLLALDENRCVYRSKPENKLLLESTCKPELEYRGEGRRRFEFNFVCSGS